MPNVDPQLFQLLNQTGLGYQGAVALASALPRTTGAAPGAAAGAGAGTTPPAPVVVAGSVDGSGTITFGTGTGPAAGNMVVVTFAAAYTAAPRVLLEAGNGVTAALDLAYTSNTTTFTLIAGNAPAASQANNVYSFSYIVLP